MHGVATAFKAERHQDAIAVCKPPPTGIDFLVFHSAGAGSKIYHAEIHIDICMRQRP